MEILISLKSLDRVLCVALTPLCLKLFISSSCEPIISSVIMRLIRAKRSLFFPIISKSTFCTNLVKISPITIKKIVFVLKVEKVLDFDKNFLSLHPQTREFSSAGSEHLPYKQRVGGSNPSTPTSEAKSQTKPLN